MLYQPLTVVTNDKHGCEMCLPTGELVYRKDLCNLAWVMDTDRNMEPLKCKLNTQKDTKSTHISNVQAWGYICVVWFGLVWLH